MAIATGSPMELETRLSIASRLSYLKETDLNRAFPLTAEVGRMLAELRKRLKETRPDT